MPVPQAAAPPPADRDWHTLAPEAVAAALEVDPAVGLSPGDAGRRLERYGRNVPPTPPRPSVARIVLGRLADPTVAVRWGLPTHAEMSQGYMNFRRLREVHYVVGEPIPEDIGADQPLNEAN